MAWVDMMSCQEWVKEIPQRGYFFTKQKKIFGHKHKNKNKVS